jgi:hypothetical protein
VSLEVLHVQSESHGRQCNTEHNGLELGFGHERSPRRSRSALPDGGAIAVHGIAHAVAEPAYVFVGRCRGGSPVSSLPNLSRCEDKAASDRDGPVYSKPITGVSTPEGINAEGWGGGAKTLAHLRAVHLALGRHRDFASCGYWRRKAPEVARIGPADERSIHFCGWTRRRYDDRVPRCASAIWERKG